MKKTVLLVVVILAMAMMVGAQSALAAKTPDNTFIAKGQVKNNLVLGSPPWAPPGPPLTVPVKGPWNVVLNIKAGHVTFTATCKDTATGAVYKMQYTGPFDSQSGVGTDTVTIEVPNMTVKRGGTSMTYGGSKIVVDKLAADPLKVDIGKTGTYNLKGDLRVFKAVP